MTIRSEIPVRNELGRLGRSRSVSVWLGERSNKVQSVRRGPLAEQRSDFPPPAAAAFPGHDRILHTLR